MGKHIVQGKNLSGHKTYNYNGFRLEVLPYFLYEICINKYWKFGFSMLGSKFFKSDKLLNIKTYNKFKYEKDFFIEKSITMLGAPYKFIINNNLSEYQLRVKRKCKKSGK